MQQNMKILSIRPAPPGGRNVRARLDVELDNGVKLFDLKLSQGSNGWRVYAPQHFGSPVAALPVTVVEAITKLAIEAMANDRSTAA